MEESSKVYSILVAEDDQEDKDLIMSAVYASEIKCKVKIVGDGEELLNYLFDAETLPDVILLDIKMPKVDGMEALKLIKEDDKLKNIPVYILSSSNSEEHKRRAKELGAARYCLKTPKYKELVDIIRDICAECSPVKTSL